MKNIAVIGGGAWGTTLAKICAENGHNVRLWVLEKDLAERINKNRVNDLYLENVELPEIKAVSEIKEAVLDADMIISAVPSQFARGITKQYKGYIKDNVIVVSVTKGLEQGTYKSMTQAIKEELGEKAMVAALSGPNHAEEISRNIPAGTVVASEDKIAIKTAKNVLQNEYFKVYPHNDMIGVEVCGAIKNIVALAAGVCDGLGLGDNAKASIITLGLMEMNMFGRRFGAKQKTFYGLAGVGDLVATCTSRHSRNRFVGEMLGKGMTLEEIKEKMHGRVAEGAVTVKAVYSYAKEKNIQMPITFQAYKVLYEAKEIKDAVQDLVRLI